MYFYIGTLFTLEVNRWFVYVSIGRWELSLGHNKGANATEH